ncbi:glutamate binding periplasmic protein [Bacillus stratosphericus LAMA 585]|nr:glutamate binding periplasmic protein [Bacillus stratosphericus LAMA 585]
MPLLFFYSTLLRNNLVRSCCGFPKSASGLSSSTIYPPSIKITRSPTSLAKPISCVTTIIVIPSTANCFITAKTSPTTSGSRADVGSSNKSTFGSIAKALAMATRCFCPPDNWLG